MRALAARASTGGLGRSVESRSRRRGDKELLLLSQQPSVDGLRVITTGYVILPPDNPATSRPSHSHKRILQVHSSGSKTHELLLSSCSPGVFMPGSARPGKNGRNSGTSSFCTFYRPQVNRATPPSTWHTREKCVGRKCVDEAQARRGFYTFNDPPHHATLVWF